MVSPENRSVSVACADVGGQDFIASGYSISGRLKNEAGTGIPGVNVALSGAASASTITNTKGEYIFSGLCPSIYSSSYVITPSAACPSLSFSPPSIAAKIYETDVTGLDFVVPVLYASVSGRITALDGTPMPGVTVILSDEASTSAVTNENGDYSLPEVQIGGHLGKSVSVGSLFICEKNHRSRIYSSRVDSTLWGGRK